MSVRAVVVVWSLALFAAAGSVALILASDRPWSASTIFLEVLVGLAFVASGLVARVRRPENRTGSLMILVGLSWFGGALQASDASLPYTVGYAAGTLIAAILIHLMLAFPSGRLLTRGERRVTVAMYAVALVLQPVWMLFDDLHGLKCDGCPRNALLIEHVEPLAVALGIVTLTAVLAILGAVLVILMRRWRAASPPSRRVLAPVYLASGVTVGFVVIRTAVDPFTEVGVGVLEWLSVLALLTVPLAFLAGLLRSRLARSAVATLVVELGETPEPGRLREALARALGDPSLELAYW
ncbi:MAG: histidine kinase, partial [Actinomycetota bacterium]|nr:histidine kinase [Actinomycetota bacterium]